MNRMKLIAVLAVLTLGLAACSESDTPQQAGGEDAQSTAAPETAAEAGAPTPTPAVSADDLMAPGPLPDQVLGEASAPVTIIEYASLTCPHCAAFHQETYPALKERYVDTGKVRFIFREFPLDNYATAGFMLARCSEGKYFPILEAFFGQQRSFLEATDPFAWIQSFAKQVGFTQETLDACLANQGLLDNIMSVRQRASEKFGVSSTPTFFINGKIKRGAMTIEELDKELEPLTRS